MVKEVKILKIFGELEWVLENEVTGEIQRGKSKNLLVDGGRGVLADFLRGETVSGVNYFAVGSGTNAPAGDDTRLQTEVGRVSISSTRQNPALAAELTAFATTAQLNGAHREVGLFGNGASAAANSGTLFSRALAEINKTNQQSLTFVWRYRISGRDE